MANYLVTYVNKQEQYMIKAVNGELADARKAAERAAQVSPIGYAIIHRRVPDYRRDGSLGFTRVEEVSARKKKTSGVPLRFM